MITIEIDESHVPDDHERYTGEKELAMQIFRRLDEGDIGRHFNLSPESVSIEVESDLREYGTTVE